MTQENDQEPVVQLQDCTNITYAPALVGIVFDLSASIIKGKINRARYAVARFIQTSHRDAAYRRVCKQTRVQATYPLTTND
jgi:hypothetical protein